MLGCLLLVSGWLIVLAALVMLNALTERIVFVAAGSAVELTGLVLLTLGYRAAEGSQE